MAHKVKVEVQSIEALRGAKGIKYSHITPHMSRGTYRDIVAGRREATPESVEKLTQIFKLPKEDIVGLLKNKG